MDVSLQAATVVVALFIATLSIFTLATGLGEKNSLLADIVIHGYTVIGSLLLCLTNLGLASLIKSLEKIWPSITSHGASAIVLFILAPLQLAEGSIIACITAAASIVCAILHICASRRTSNPSPVYPRVDSFQQLEEDYEAVSRIDEESGTSSIHLQSSVSTTNRSRSPSPFVSLTVGSIPTPVIHSAFSNEDIPAERSLPNSNDKPILTQFSEKSREKATEHRTSFQTEDQSSVQNQPQPQQPQHSDEEQPPFKSETQRAPTSDSRQETDFSDGELVQEEGSDVEQQSKRAVQESQP